LAATSRNATILLSMSALDSTTRLLDALRTGHESARDPLLQHCWERCRLLARRMFRRHKDLRSVDETDDVLQLAMVRLHRALEQVHPPSVPAFLGLAARQIRWVLCDLARKHAVAKVVTIPGDQAVACDAREGMACEPADLLEWAEFHERIEALPVEERETFDLLFYQGLPQAEAAALLEISVRSVKRRWQRARLLLRDALRGEWPSL
jgi:RNA polymerase sigma factor (sigma-70 family)